MLLSPFSSIFSITCKHHNGNLAASHFYHKGTSGCYPDWFPLNQTRNISGSNWARLVPDFSKDEFVVSPTSPSSSLFFVKELWSQCTALFVRLMLPQGFPQSVTFDYLDYSLCEPSKALQAKLVVSLPPRYLSIILVILLLLLLVVICSYFGQ